MIQSKAFSFQIFDFPVRVDLSFFLMALILGSGRSDLTFIAIWVLVVFISVLAHELGHAFVARKYGLHPWIELYSGGGLTWHQVGARLSHIEEIALSLAGPGVGFLIGAVVWWIGKMLPYAVISRNLRVLMFDLVWVNIGWGIINLLPILPLDGGNVMRVIVQKIRGCQDERLPLKISIGFGVALFLLALVSRMFFGAILSGWFTYRNYQQLQNMGGW